MIPVVRETTPTARVSHSGSNTMYDYVLVGGGLQNALIALALRTHQPSARIALVEREDRLGGSHTWCFHESDIDPAAWPWLEPLVTYRWPAYRVAFPDWDRTLEGGYAGISSEQLDTVVQGALEAGAGSALLLESSVEVLRGDSVELESGYAIRGRLVIDGRGPPRSNQHDPVGYQKFLGLELELAEPHGMEIPVLMDARLDQGEGYRFMYVLPLGARRVLVEDTFFNESPDLDVEEITAAIGEYARTLGWEISSVVREERGVLPMPWAGSSPSVDASPLLAGYRGGWFHPGTGYSMPIATRLANLVGRSSVDALPGGLRSLGREIGRQARFARFLNRMLFRWYPPMSRRAVFERFYRLPAETILRFYGLRLSFRDRVRLLLGRPPPGLSISYRLARRR